MGKGRCKDRLSCPQKCHNALIHLLRAFQMQEVASARQDDLFHPLGEEIIHSFEGFQASGALRWVLPFRARRV